MTRRHGDAGISPRLGHLRVPAFPVRLRRFLLAGLIACVLAAGARAALAAGQVSLEVVTEERVSLTAQQEWGRRLAQAGLSNVRFHAKQAGGEDGDPQLGDAERAALPGRGRVDCRRNPAGARRRFRAGDVARAQTLAGRPGPQRSAGEPSGEDGLRAGGGPVPAGGKGPQPTGRLPHRRRQPPASNPPHPAAIVPARPLEAGEAAGG